MEEFNLRKYFDVIRKQWIVLVMITVVAVVVASLFSFLQPRTYEAKASVIITKARNEITLEPKYQTVWQEDFTSQSKAMIALVKSSTIATQVIKILGDKLDPEERTPEKILKKIKVGQQGDLIEISVGHIEPQKATDIANAWTKSYESYINGLYSGISLSTTELQIQVATASKEYKEKQKAWEDFSSNNRVDELGRQINDKELLCRLKSLQEQIKTGSPSSASNAANSLAYILLQTQAFTSLISGLQISLDAISSLKTDLEDLDNLISTLEIRLGGVRGQSINELRQEILQLWGQLEQERARQQELQKSRDIAWNTFTTLDSKAAEVQVGTLVQNAMVRVAESASVPESPVAPRRSMTIGIALILGLLLGVFGAFVVESFKKTRK